MISKSKEKNKVLGYFFTNPEAKHYINEIASILGMYPANANKRLKEFEKDGILKSEFLGKQRYYSLNKDFPLLKQYREIFQKTFGVEKKIKDAFAEKEEIEEVYIFGSYARNTMDIQSDIDILVVGNYPAIELEKTALLLQKEFGREFNIISISKKEFSEKQKIKNPFIAHIFSNKIIKVK